MSNLKKRVKVLPWPDKENCFLVISGPIMKKTNYGEKWYTGHQEYVQQYHSNETCEPRITFTYSNDKVAVEWDGAHGPIQCWYKCEKDYKSEYDHARPHWIFDYAYGSGMWSQMAVDNNHLVQSFNEGDYDHIFNVLKRFAVERSNNE
jgi:hypothetical protein